jgi:TolB protein
MQKVAMKIFILLMIFTQFVFSGDSTIEIIKKVTQLPSITVEDGSDESFDEDLSKRFYRLLVNDLIVLTHFNVKDKYEKVFYGRKDSSFSNRNVDYVIRYKLYKTPENGINCDVKVISTNSQREFFSKSYKTQERELYPFVAHQISSNINTHFGMPNVDWLTRYVIFSRYTKPKESEIVIADYTLTYQKVIFKGGLNLFPKWDSQKQHGFYFTRYERKPVLYHMNILKGELKKILTSEGMLVCSDVRDDGKALLLTMAPNGQPDIYFYDLEENTRKILTSYHGIDVGGHFIEDNSRITFISDRLGYPNVFAKTIDKKDVEQLVYYGRNNNSCTSYKNYIVYSSRETDNTFSDNSFNLHLISTNTDFVRRLTASGVNQFPKFSSDGESVLFIKHHKNQSSLGVIRLKYNKSFLFPLNSGKIQSIDW